MSEIKLNLARKWRSKNFDQIIGQELSVRMIKNSLYLQQYFPVYLFSGQRGCGKTTTARVFAAALNCTNLETFQTNPAKTVVPCLTCQSCKAMEKGKHPDFIEIDAASHTGVDNVRSIVEAASLMPLMGRKKIYLIDEAHMLSKAAFNAFLKILEEPPASVLFILATTDPQKIIETVRSRCFQLIFKPVADETIFKQLVHICVKESIAYEDEGLHSVVKQTEGSVRDAINLLEQVRFSNNKVTQQAVLQVLGYVDDTLLLGLFDAVLNRNPRALLACIKELAWHQYAPTIIYRRLIELGRTALWLKYGVVPDGFEGLHASIRTIISRISAAHLNFFLTYLFDQETIFNRTVAKHDVLEMILLHICYTINGDGDQGGAAPASSTASPEPVTEQQESDDVQEDDEEEETEDEDDVAGDVELNCADGAWKQFVASIGQLDDPLLTSIFSQATFKGHNAEAQRVEVEFSKEYVFFKQMLDDSQSSWSALFIKKFAGCQLVPSFTGDSIKKERIHKVVSIAPVVKPQPQKNQKTEQKNKYATAKPFKRARMVVPPFFAHEKAVDVSDQNQWTKTHMVLRSFAGAVTQIDELL